MTGFLFLMVTFLFAPSSGESKNSSHWIFQWVSYQPLESPFQSAITCSNTQGRFKNKSTIFPHKTKNIKNPQNKTSQSERYVSYVSTMFAGWVMKQRNGLSVFWFHTVMSHFCCSSVTKSCPTLWDLMDGGTPGFPVLHHLPEFAPSSCPLNQWCHPTISSSVAPTEHIQLTEGGRGNQFPVPLTCSHLQQIAPSKIWPLGFCFSRSTFLTVFYQKAPSLMHISDHLLPCLWGIYFYGVFLENSFNS